MNVSLGGRRHFCDPQDFRLQREVQQRGLPDKFSARERRMNFLRYQLNVLGIPQPDYDRIVSEFMVKLHLLPEHWM